MNLRRVGKGAEEFVKRELINRGIEVKAMNFNAKSGEIDIVAKDEKYLIFVEVKYRKSEGAGSGASAVGIKKQKNISRAALFYMTRYGWPSDTPVRFDVAEVTGEKEYRLRYIENAFEFVL